MSRLGEDGCQVTCHIDMDGREYSIHRECLTGLNETITMTIWRRVHPFVTELLILCLIVVVFVSILYHSYYSKTDVIDMIGLIY